MAQDPWLTEFRALHDRAKKGDLRSAEQRAYLAAREQLAKTLTKIQGLTMLPNQTARQSFRVALALPVKIELAGEPQRAVTLDVGTGGFATMIQKVPNASEQVGFELKLPGGAMPVAGRARLVDARKQVGNFRAAFAFVDLSPSDIEAVEWALFENVLTRLGT